jgi:transposase
MQYALLIECEVPRCQCPEHGVKQVSVPWAEPNSRFTLLFEAFAIRVIEACVSLSDAARLLNVSWNTVHTIVSRAVERGMKRRGTDGITKVGIDEKSFGSGQDYISIMCDLTQPRVLEVVQGRDTQAVKSLWDTLTAPQRDGIEAAAMDMGNSMIAGTRESVPNADIVHDRFHVSKLLNEAVDAVRRKEHARLKEEENDILSGSRYLFLKKELKEEEARQFRKLMDANLETGKAWALKEQMSWFWEQPDAKTGNEFIQRWLSLAQQCSFEAMRKAGATLSSHLSGLLSYFKHRITNAMCEGFNSKIQALKGAARGFRNFANYRARILFFCGRLNLEPCTQI